MMHEPHIDDDDMEEKARVLALVEDAGPDILTEEEAEIFVSCCENAGNPDDHNANLADYVDDAELDRLASKIAEWVDLDDNSRQEWLTREARGIRMLGMSDRAVGGASFKGASKAVHPLLNEACVQFQARAIAEMWPPEGPVKGIVIGTETEERQAQKDRVVDFLNYQYTRLMPGAFEEEDKLLYRLPLSGSVFVKTAYDPLEETVVRRMVEPADFIVPYSASDLRTAPRYTHRDRVPYNDVLRLMQAGFYRKVELVQASESDSRTTVHDEVDHNDGRENVEWLDDQRRPIYECHCYYDMPGFEDVDESGGKTGIGLPYIVTVDKDALKVLAIRRNWKDGDVKHKKRLYFTHYGFVPGLGFYYSGFLHLIGSLADAATGSLRALLDAAQFSNMQGGYKARDAKIPGGGDETPLAPGEWRDVDCPSEELSKAFFPIPYKEPSEALFKLLGFLDEAGRRFASTTEVTVPETNRNSPVGTTLALIEQGLKVFSAVHKRLHEAKSREFAMVAELNAEYLPPAYPYEVAGGEKHIMAADFDGRIDVVPVSDPNIVSNVQRISQAQAVLQLADQAPDLYDRRAAHEQMLEALKVRDIDRLLPDKSAVPRQDPVSENMGLLTGKPIKAWPDQDHAAHAIAHEQFFMSLPPPMQQATQPAYMAHQMEHQAWAYRAQIEQMIGQPLPPPVMENDEDKPQDVDPQMDAQISMAVAYAIQSAQAVAQQQAVELQQQSAIEAQQQQAAQLQQQAQQIEAEQALKDAETAREQDRKDAEAEREMSRQDAIAAAELEQKARENEAQRVTQQERELLGNPAPQ